MRPGLWELSGSIDSMDGLPPQVVELVKAQWVPRTYSTCLKPDQVDKPPQEFFTEARGNCSYEHFSMSHGKINATLKCPSPEDMMVGEITGKVKPESLRLSLNLIIDTPDGERGAVDMTIEGKRIGDC